MIDSVKPQFQVSSKRLWSSNIKVKNYILLFNLPKIKFNIVRIWHLGRFMEQSNSGLFLKENVSDQHHSETYLLLYIYNTPNLQSTQMAIYITLLYLQTLFILLITSCTSTSKSDNHWHRQWPISQQTSQLDIIQVRFFWVWSQPVLTNYYGQTILLGTQVSKTSDSPLYLNSLSTTTISCLISQHPLLSFLWHQTPQRTIN